jgi:hypothetical protein
MLQRRFPIVIGLVSLLMAGCSHEGLSPREVGSQSYTAYLMAMYENPKFMAGPPPAMRSPSRIAVAQVGEIAPPQKMLDYLREQRPLFAAVDGVPGMLTEANVPNETAEGAKVRIRRDLERMQAFAQSLGADYLFLYGGTVDYGTDDTPLGVLDVTIIGAFIVPSKSIKGIAKASGALIEARSGRVVLIATAESQKSTISATAQRDDNSQRLVNHMRESVMEGLAQRFVEQCKANTTGKS